MPKGQKRGDQPYTGGRGTGMGVPFTSPVKRSKPRKQLVAPLGNLNKRRRLAQELEELEQQAGATSSAAMVPLPDANIGEPFPPPNEDSGNNSLTDAVLLDSPLETPPEVPPTTPKPRRTEPNRAAKSLSSRWQNILPSLVEPFLTYSASVIGRVPLPPDELKSHCLDTECSVTKIEILCLFHTHYAKTLVQFCKCSGLVTTLISHGLFPTAPSQPRMAVSVHLLDFYHALFERSCDAVNALAAALSTFYKRRGFVPINEKGQPVQDPFRKGLGHAIQWYDNLQIRIEEVVEGAVVDADAQNRCKVRSGAGDVDPPPLVEASASLEPEETLQPASPTPPPELTECARILQRRCPACFGGTLFGAPFEKGCDVQVCVDGNFNHRHLKSSGDCPPFYDPEYILPKSFVDSIGHKIEEARKKPPKKRQAVVPNDAVDECESSHVAGSGSNSKTNMEKFDDSGLMALVCRHDIPLFLTNIDSPGEQQKYAVALIIHLFSLLPRVATVATLYDVGCVLDRSSQLFDIFPKSIQPRVMFATSAMHAYVHEWACQLGYNPRLCIGLGLTDGEGVERLWSRLRKLIGITRALHRRRRVWMVDRQVRSIGDEYRDGLGSWIRRRLGKGVEGQGLAARQALAKSGISTDVLRAQWADQRKAQLSIRAHAPVRLKKELDSVLTIQGQMEAVDQAIQSLQSELAKSQAPKESLALLTSLQKTQEEFKERGEALYSSLNVHDTFPELKGVDLEFIRVLFMARDLKINVRKRAIGSFLEWDKLDQAAGGRDQSLGTKLHQATRNAISKRAPALMNAIRKFNGYCATLASLNKEEWNIPLPSPLPVKLAELRESPVLMEDVWISTTTPKERPRWLAEPKIREGIRALLRVDRCLEEQKRLGVEADNLCRWFGRELRALEAALALPSNSSISIQLTQRRDHLLSLKSSWSSPLASIARFDAHVTAAEQLKDGSKPTTAPLPSLQWMPAVTTTQGLHVVVLSGNEDDDGGDEPLPDSEPTEPAETAGSQEVEIHGADGEDNTMLVDYILDSNADNEEDRAGVAPVATLWALPEKLQEDTELLSRLRFQTFGAFAPANLERILPDGTGRTYFDERSMSIMSSPRQMLNDVCVNGLANLLQYHFSASFSSSQCAIFSTFDLPMIRFETTDEHIWRRTYKTEYWSKESWIIPIHRPNELHWVLACVQLKTRQILLFDSFAAQKPWEEEVPVIHRFIEKLVLNANRKGHPLHVVTDEGWVANPVLLQACQTNGYDCGLWVLATIASLLNGFQKSGLAQANMPEFRHLLLQHILALPAN